MISRRVRLAHRTAAGIITAAIIIAALAVFLLPLTQGIPSEAASLYPTSVPSGAAIEYTVVSCDGSAESTPFIACYGHAFTVLHNTGSETALFCGQTLAPGETLTFGWWATDAHGGVWFNMESNYIALWNRYAERVGYTVTVGGDALAAVTDYITAHDYYTPLCNCAMRAGACFDLAVGSPVLDVGLFASPAELCRKLYLIGTGNGVDDGKADGKLLTGDFMSDGFAAGTISYPDRRGGFYTYAMPAPPYADGKK